MDLAAVAIAFLIPIPYYPAFSNKVLPPECLYTCGPPPVSCRRDEGAGPSSALGGSGSEKEADGVMKTDPRYPTVKRTLQFVIQSLRCGCCALSSGLLLAASGGAQQIIQLPAEDRWLEADFEELYRLGSMAGEDWEQFGYIRSVAFDGAGNLFLFDRFMETQIVFVVGSDGRLVRQLGGPGEGPGEFGHAGAVAVFADGRVAVVDVGRRGYHIFAADGEFERLVRIAKPSGVTSVGRVVAQPGADAIIGVPTLATIMDDHGGSVS